MSRAWRSEASAASVTIAASRWAADSLRASASMMWGGTTAQRQPARAQSCATGRYIAARMASGSWSRKPAAASTPRSSRRPGAG